MLTKGNQIRLPIENKILYASYKYLKPMMHKYDMWIRYVNIRLDTRYMDIEKYTIFF